MTPHPIGTPLTWVNAIPEIQWPFLWNVTTVYNLLDSLYQGYPIGSPITWRNPSARLRGGSKSSAIRILIDGQQRVTALMSHKIKAWYEKLS